MKGFAYNAEALKAPAVSFWKITLLGISLAMVWNYAPVLIGKIPFPSIFFYYSPIFAPVAPENVDSRVPNIGDVVTGFFPYRVLASRTWRDGFPIWEPNLQAGKPFLANPQSALFYPLNAFFYILPVSIAWCISRILHPFLAAMFTALFLRRLGASATGGLIAGLVFAFSGFMTVWQAQAMADAAIWLPLICYSVARLHEERSAASVAVTAIAFAMPVLAGHPETVIHITLVGVALALFLAALPPSVESSRQPFRYLVLFGLAGLLAMGLAAVQLVATMEWIPHLNRDLDIVWPSVPLRSIIGFVSRDILSPSNSFGLQIPEQAAYVGMIAFLGFPIAWLHAQRRYVIFFTVSMIVALCVAYGIPPIYTLSLHVPILMGLKNNRLILVATFAIAVLAGLGVSVLQNLEKEERNRRIRASLLAAAGVCLAAFMIYLVQINLVARPVGSSRFPKASLMFLTLSTIPVALRLGGLLRTRQFNFLLAGVVIVDVCSFSYGLLPFENPQYILPEDRFFARISSKTPEPVRLLQVGEVYTANAELLYGIQSSGGYEIPLRRIIEFTQGAMSDSAGGTGGIGQDSKQVFDVTDRRMDMLSTKYYVVSNGDPLYKKFLESPGRFRFLYEFGKTSMFENLRAMPPAFLVPSSGVMVIRDERAQMDLIRSANYDPERTVVLEEPFRFALTGGVPGNVQWIERKNASLRLKVESDTNSVLVLSQIYYPGWKAFVDGKQTPVFPADYALTGIAVAPGSHDVIFKFDPLSFKIGLLLSTVTVFVLGALLYRRPKHLWSRA